MWVVPSVGPNDQQDLMVLFHLLLCAELRHCSPQSSGTAMKLLCATNPEQTTYVNLGTGLSNPWLDYLTLHSGSWSSTWEKTICKLRHAGLRGQHPKKHAQTSTRKLQQTLNTLYWGQRWDEISLHCPESFRVLYQVTVVTMNIYDMCALYLLINTLCMNLYFWKAEHMLEIVSNKSYELLNIFVCNMGAYILRGFYPRGLLT